jgi:uncharacterized protein (DUF1778 family)
MASATSKNERINLRLERNAKDMLEKAASLEGKTVSNYILASALAEAEKTLQAHQSMHLQIEEAEAFYAALAGPIRFDDKLVEALAEHGKRVDSQ